MSKYVEVIATIYKSFLIEVEDSCSDNSAKSLAEELVYETIAEEIADMDSRILPSHPKRRYDEVINIEDYDGEDDD